MASRDIQLLLLVTCVVIISGVKVSEVNCTAGGHECPGKSACDTNAGSKCKCDDTYAEDTTNGATCVLKVTSTNCSTQDQACTGIDHSVCKSSKCSCNDGFMEVADKCNKVAESKCTVPGSCPGNSNTECVNKECACVAGYAEKSDVCTKILKSDCNWQTSGSCPPNTNTKCNSGKCDCDDGFAEKDDVCTKKVSETDCSSDKKCIANAECVNSKCRCSNGYTEKVDVCEKNAATIRCVSVFAVLLSAVLVSLTGQFL